MLGYLLDMLVLWLGVLCGKYSIGDWLCCCVGFDVVKCVLVFELVDKVMLVNYVVLVGLIKVLLLCL